ncbi:hypothetical protein [Nocardia sp. NPDC052112]|uniref:hypothetical protein n=1 Tax=Nocardia sp. NPDC052112 TaxID=3155646 RepID=UPI00341C743C
MQREIELGAEAAQQEQDLLAAVPDGDDDTLWQALVDVVRADLRIAEPGYDTWEGV